MTTETSPTPTDTLTPAAIYEDARGQFIAFIRSLPAETLERQVPSCPAWTARQIVAHLVGAAEDFMVANFPSPSMTFEEWTEAQVARNDHLSLDELLAKYDGQFPAVLKMVAEGSIPAVPLINDTATHEQDIRGMAGIPGGREASGYRFCYDIFAQRFGARIAEAGLPAVALRSEEGDRACGEGEPTASVRTSSFELFRALGGRRSTAQMHAFSWDGGADAYVPLMPAFGPSQFDIVERE